MDTSTFTHFCRAGHGEILRLLAPQGLILIPDTVYSEVQEGRDRDYDIPAIGDLDWVEIGVLTPAEEGTQLDIKIRMPSVVGDSPRKHLGECAVLACAIHRGMIAVIDDRGGRGQAVSRGVRYVDSMWIIAQARKTLDGVDSEAAERIYADLVATGMRLPQVESFIGWAYQVGLLP
jgi:predicted nucleic acid-binding protein